jgi:splicing suppressor protein 51
VNCHRNTFELKENEKLTICDHCKLVHHCTACNTSVSIHEAECPKLQEVTAAELFAIQHYLLTRETTVQMPTQKPREMYIPLSTAESWYDYFTKISDKTMVTGLLSHDLKPLAGNDEMALALHACTGRTSSVLTIIAALEVIFRERLATISTLNLHLIGADSVELESSMLMEEILHLLPALKTLHCSFVGLDIPKPICFEEKLMLDCCGDCTRAGRTKSIYL